MTSPRGLLRSAPTALARSLGVVTALARGRPVGLVPEQALVATMRHQVVDHRRRHHASFAATGGAERVLRQEGGARPAPGGTVAPTRRARPLAVQHALHLRRSLHPCGTMHERLHGQRLLHKAKPAAAMPGGLSVTLFELGRRLHLVCHACQVSNMMFHAADSNLLQRYKRGNCCTPSSKTALQIKNRPRRAALATAGLVTVG
jgi:hypothetical protein